MKLIPLTLFTFLSLFVSFSIKAQSESPLKLEMIMKGYDWIGHSPSNPTWSDDSKTLMFNWNPEMNPSDSLYKVTIDNLQPLKLTPEEKAFLPGQDKSINNAGTLMVYAKYGDLFLFNFQNSQRIRLTQTNLIESNPRFLDNHRILFQLNNNLWVLELEQGKIIQLTDFKSGKKPGTEKKISDQEEWLHEQQLVTSIVINQRDEDKKASDKYSGKLQPKMLSSFYTGNMTVRGLELSPDERFITFRLNENGPNNSTYVAEFVNESGFTKPLYARSKVGVDPQKQELWIIDRQSDSSYQVSTDDIPGIRNFPEFSYENKKDISDKKRDVVFTGPLWSPDNASAIVVIRSQDNKDRWIMTLDPENGKLKTLDRQTDNAWIGGPGISSWNFSMGDIGWMPDSKSIWFQSEEKGFSHLCSISLKNGKKKWLTSGAFEIYNPFISKDKKWIYYTSNEVNSGERYFYKIPIQGGRSIRLVNLPGRNDVTISPDEKWLAILNSNANNPWELYLAENKQDDTPTRITRSQTEEFKSYAWRKPELITFPGLDNIQVPARLYEPETHKKNNAAVIFVHGAGYLQNAHNWWSSYYREYMFHNMLADYGYTVIDIDYRGSAGYGRDWRTAIYRHMGGKDLEDQLAGVKFLIDRKNIDPNKIGIYGGSYGGFITLMALFKHPGVFQAGAALRSVTDWAHYNHSYTSNILNTPSTDSLAFTRSSPIYFAEGLADHLLICHGMVDTNVQFQDVVRLAQRLIELGKEDWEMAVYPVENHGFVETSSWVDEYRRIFELFQEHLN